MVDEKRIQAIKTRLLDTCNLTQIQEWLKKELKEAVEVIEELEYTISAFEDQTGD